MSTPAGNPYERLAELGLTLPVAAPPLASYVPAVRSGSLVFTSGQLPLVDGELRFTGSVGEGEGAGVAPDLAAEQAQVCALNALAAIEALVGLSAVRRVVKVTGFVAAAPGFFGAPAVVNGASDLLTAVFGEDGRHARSAVGVFALPLGAPVEVEVVVEIDALTELAELVEDEGELLGDTDLPVDLEAPRGTAPVGAVPPVPPAGLPTA
jgi:enamine deaminase RidA (YjgF/YER057c/UK114 family)